MDKKAWLLSILFCLSFSFSSHLFAQENESSKVLWLTLEEAMNKSKTEKRKVLLFLYTDWCVWCKKMETITFSQDAIADFINRNYYPVRFNAEDKESVKFQDKVYTYEKLKPRGVNGFAVEMMRGRVNFPTVTFFDKNWEVIQSIPNFQPPLKFEQIITYFAGDHYKKTPWSVYEESYLPFSVKGKN